MILSVRWRLSLGVSFAGVARRREGEVRKLEGGIGVGVGVGDGRMEGKGRYAGRLGRGRIRDDEVRLMVLGEGVG